MRRVVGLAIGFVVVGCSSAPVFTQVTAWSASTQIVDLAQISAQLARDPGTDPVRPAPDTTVQSLGVLAGTDLAFVRLRAKPAAGGVNDRDCIVVLSEQQVVDHYCELDGEFLPRSSRLGYLALPLYDNGVTFVRLTICGQHYWEHPYNGFAVFPITSDQSMSPYAAEVFRGTHALGIQGQREALHAHGCVRAS